MYFSVGIYVLRFRLDSLVLPHTDASTSSFAPILRRIGGRNGSLLIRRYGVPRVGCVLFFPGQHGNIPGYEANLFPAFTAQGIAVLAVAYPGQDGAPGVSNLDQVQALAAQAVTIASDTCGKDRVVVYGRSLGSMVAAFSVKNHSPSGLILEGAAPSLSSAIRSRLASHWYLAPMTILPISKLLAHDFALAEALPRISSTPVVVFQGTEDSETPLSTLRANTRLLRLLIIAVPGATHSTTYRLVERQIVETSVSMLRQQRT